VMAISASRNPYERFPVVRPAAEARECAKDGIDATRATFVATWTALETICRLFVRQNRPACRTEQQGLAAIRTVGWL
jgi:hypothetical protein